MANYIGIGFPLSEQGGEIPVRTVGIDVLKQSIEQILMTSLGERVMRPAFGSSLIDLVNEDNDALLQSLVESAVLQALQDNDNRIKVVEVKQESKDDSLIVEVIFEENSQIMTTSVKIT